MTAELLRLKNEVYLKVNRGSYDGARCERDPLPGPSEGFLATVQSCEPDAGGWYRTGGDWHEYVARRAGHHLTVGASLGAVDREALVGAALDARRQDETATLATRRPLRTAPTCLRRAMARPSIRMEPTHRAAECGQRCQRYGVVVDTLRKPYRSKIGREYSVESLLMRVLPRRSADRARAAVNAR